MKIICLDLEGVLVPEIWIGVAERTGIEELRLTTRDISDYDVLMKRRLEILEDKGLGNGDIHEGIDKLRWPSLYCNDLEIDGDGRVTGYRLRQPDQKRKAVQAFKALNFDVLAAGDSYNDLSMLTEADAGVLFRPPEKLVAEYPEFPVTETHEELHAALLGR